MSPFPKKAANLAQLGVKPTKTIFFGSSNNVLSRKRFFLPRLSLQACALGIILIFPLLVVLNASGAEKTPLLALETPPSPLTITTPFFRLEGMADPLSHVVINDQEVILRESGYFSELVPLSQGVNTIEVKASKLGKEKIEARTVVYSPIN